MQLNPKVNYFVSFAHDIHIMECDDLPQRQFIDHLVTIAGFHRGFSEDFRMIQRDTFWSENPETGVKSEVSVFYRNKGKHSRLNDTVNNLCKTYGENPEYYDTVIFVMLNDKHIPQPFSIPLENLWGYEKEGIHITGEGPVVNYISSPYREMKEAILREKKEARKMKMGNSVPKEAQRRSLRSKK